MGGLLSVWDWMFGTLVLPTKGETIVFGVGDGRPQPHGHVVAAYLVPFWEVIPFRQAVAARLRKARGRQAAADPAHDLVAGD
jgi:hypothetical protein